MKVCSKCNEPKDLAEFHKNRSKSDGLHSYCKTCSNAKTRDYYSRNRVTVRSQIRAANAKKTDSNEIRLFEYLSSHPCVDCGEADVLVLELDHVSGEKRNAVTLMTKQGCAWATIEAEIAKCVVRCSNCHRRKTARECHSRRYRWASARR